MHFSFNFGFGYVGLIFLLGLFIPNIIWIKRRPVDYDEYSKKENPVLGIIEKIGEVAVTCCAVFFSDFTVSKIDLWSLWLLGAVLLMVCYEIYWIRYFKSNRTMKDMYSSLFGVPLAGATYPVLAFLLLGIYGRNLLMLIAVIFLGIGHISIHYSYKKMIESL